MRNVNYLDAYDVLYDVSKDFGNNDEQSGNCVVIGTAPDDATITYLDGTIEVIDRIVDEERFRIPEKPMVAKEMLEKINSKNRRFNAVYLSIDEEDGMYSTIKKNSYYLGSDEESVRRALMTLGVTDSYIYEVTGNEKPVRKVYSVNVTDDEGNDIKSLVMVISGFYENEVDEIAKRVFDATILNEKLKDSVIDDNTETQNNYILFQQ